MVTVRPPHCKDVFSSIVISKQCVVWCFATTGIHCPSTTGHPMVLVFGDVLWNQLWPWKFTKEKFSVILSACISWHSALKNRFYFISPSPSLSNIMEPRTFDICYASLSLLSFLKFILFQIWLVDSFPGSSWICWHISIILWAFSCFLVYKIFPVKPRLLLPQTWSQPFHQRTLIHFPG